MAGAFIIRRGWIGITLDSQLWSDWIALVMRIPDGGILSVHEPERQTVDGVDGGAVVGDGCENPHLIEEVYHLLCRLAVTVPEFGKFHFRYGELPNTEVSREVLLLVAEWLYCRQREKRVEGFHAVEALVVIFEEIKLLPGQKDSILYILVFHLLICLW